MKNECDIVRDLLFSYNDGVLSETSKEFVENHLRGCESCGNVLKEIKDDNNDVQDQIKVVDFFKSVKKKLFNKNLIIVTSVIISLVIIIFNILVYKNYNEIASTIQIYLKNDISEQELENIKSNIIENFSDVNMSYVSKQQSLEMMKTNFDGADFLDSLNEQSNPLPAFIEVKSNSNLELIVSMVQDMPGVQTVSTHLNMNPYLLFIYNAFVK